MSGEKSLEHGWKSWATMVGGAASILVLLTTVCSPVFFDGDSATGVSGQDYGFNPWALGEEPQEEIVDEIEMPTAKGRWIQLIDEQDRVTESKLFVGAPGMWPFITKETGPGGYAELPSMEADMMDGRQLQLYEVMARSVGEQGQQYGFWGMVHGPGDAVSADEARQVRMKAAHPLELEVIDRSGDPIEGAYVRLSQDSVGLVHLHFTTLVDGQVRFQSIPDGTYYLTLDAEGYARHTVRVQHSADASQLSVVLDDGAGLRLPQSWRGPPVQELAARGRGASGGTASGGSGAQSAAGSAPRPGGGSIGGNDGGRESGEAGQGQESQQEMVTIEVRVADKSGGGVTGAWIEAWGDGRRLAQGKSKGRSAEELVVPAGVDVELVATHAGWGEGTKSLGSVGDGDDFIVRLDRDLLSESAARDRLLWIDEIEAHFDIELVDERPRWLIEPDVEGAGAGAGLERGDSLLFVRQDGASYVAVVERRRNIIEIAVH